MRRRVLLVHNYYQQPGGEDMVFESEAALLESYGHSVRRLVFDNDEIRDRRSPMASAHLAQTTIWSREAAARVREATRDFGAEIVHFHNTFPLVSPAAYSAARSQGAAVVQTLHNYRLLCPNSLFFRDGHTCEDCLGRTLPWPGVQHACYRGSRAQTAVVAAMLTAHRLRHTWDRDVDLFISLTEFGRQKFIQGGMPAQQVVVKPNFVFPDPGPGNGQPGYVLFVGRLSMEKGVHTLLTAWEQLGDSAPLRIVGDGPLAGLVQNAQQKMPHVRWLGQKPTSEVFDLMGGAACLVFPSEWYEGLPRTIVESFAMGTPVVASNIGALTRIVQPGLTGLHFRPGDAEDLAACVRRLLEKPEWLAKMRRQARAEFQSKYTADQNYLQLIMFYELAIEQSRRAAACPAWSERSGD